MSEILLEFSQKAIISKYDPDSKLKHYFDLLQEENQKINLVSRETSRQDLERLAAESLLPFEVIESRNFKNYLDIGTGGGLPALPIIMCIAPQKSTLVERTKKKAGAIARISSNLGLRPSILNTNFEECDFNEKFDLITLRLVKLDKPLFRKISNLLSIDGIFVYYSNYSEDTSKTGFNKSVHTYNTSADTPSKKFTIISKES